MRFPKPKRAQLWTSLGIAISTVLFSWVALWNGYPLVYHDTGVYLLSSHTPYVPIDRPVFYGLFLRFARCFTNSNWPPVFVQSFALAFLVAGATRLLGKKANQTRATIACAGALAAFTGMPWLTGQLMPDAWTAIVALSLFLILYGWTESGRTARAAWGALFCAGCLIHYSHFPIAVLTLALVYGLGRLRPALRAPGFTRAWILLAIAAPVAIGVPRLLRNELSSPDPFHLTLLAPLVRDGIVQDLLDARCPEAGYALCEYRIEMRKLKRDEFRWSRSSPLHLIGGVDGSRDEGWRLIRDSLAEFPDRIVSRGIDAWIYQFLAFRTGDGLRAYGDEDPAKKFLAEFHPEELGEFLTSRQQRGTLLETSAILRNAHLFIVFGAFLIVGLWLVYRSKAADDLLVAYSAFALAFTATNAAVCGYLSGPLDRYQSRVVGLIVLAAALVLLHEVPRLRKNRKRRN